MKNILLKFCLVSMLAIVLTACNKLKEALLPAIEVNLPAFQLQVPAIPVVLAEEASLGSFTMRFNLESTIRANTGGTFGAGAVSTVKVKQVVINVPNADQNNNLSNFESARFNLSSNTKTMPAELIAINFPDTFSTSVTAVPENSPELEDYIKGSELVFTIYGKARRITTKALTFNVVITLSAK